MNTKQIVEMKDFEENLRDSDKLVIKPYQQDNFGEHNHHFFELVYVTGGSAVQLLNDEPKLLKQGDFFIVDYGSVHSYTSCEGLTLINCLFLPEIIDDTLKGCHSFDALIQKCLLRYHNLHIKRTPANFVFHDNEDERVLGLLKGMMAEYQHKEIGYLEILKSKLMEIIIITARNVLDDIPFISNKTVIYDVIEFINSNYVNSNTLQEFCVEHHYSQQYISRKFKETTGINVSKYCQKVRIQKSCDLLAGSEKAISEIALEVGYKDIKSFNKLFKETLKITPREYRKEKITPSIRRE